LTAVWLSDRADEATVRSSRLAFAVLAFALLSSPCLQAASGPTECPLEVQYAFFRKAVFNDPGSVHVGIRNHGSEECSVLGLRLAGRPLFEPEADLVGGIPEAFLGEGAAPARKPEMPQGDVMWFDVSHPILKPGGLSEVIVKFTRTPTEPVRVAVVPVEGEALDVEIEPVPPPYRVSAVTFGRDYREAYLYVENMGTDPLAVTGARVDGGVANRPPRIVNPELEPGDKACVCIAFDKPLARGEWVFLVPETSAGSEVGVAVRAFSCFPIERERGSVVQPGAFFDWDGFDDRRPFVSSPYGRLDMVAHEAVRNRQDPEYARTTQMLTYWSNQGFIKQGVMAFGELVDGVCVHCQPGAVEYLGAYNDLDKHFTQAKVRFIRDACAPHPLYPQTEVGHAMMSSDYRGLLNPDELRLRVYYVVGRGAKGILYRCGGLCP